MSAIAATADLVTAILLVIVAILGLVLNGLVILTVLQNKGLRNPFTSIICFICLAHVFEYLIPLPQKVVGELLHLDVPKWSLGSMSCKVSNFAFYALTYAVIYSILLLVVDRYMEVKKRNDWSSKKALMLCSVVALAFIILNTGVLLNYGLTEEPVKNKPDMETCGLVQRQGVTLGLFFMISYLAPLVATFGGVVFLTRLLRIRKEYQLGDEVDKPFISKMAIIIFAFASYAVLRLVWHVDRLLLAGGLTFDYGDLIVQDVAEVLWYLHGVLLAAFFMIVYPDFKQSARDLCCGPSPYAPALSTYSSEDDLILMPVVTTEADPDRFETWPQDQYRRPLHGSEASLASTTISSQEQPTSPSWRVVRTLDRPQPGQTKPFVERVPVQRKVKSPERGKRGDSSARSRSSSPASEHREDTMKSRRPRLFKKKKSKKGESSGDEGHR